MLNFDDAIIIPALVSQIKTDKAGGYRLVLDVPEIAQEQIKQLIGSENRIVYSVGLLNAGTIEAKPQRGPGRPKNSDT